MSDQAYKGYVIRPHLNNPKSFIIIVPGRGGKIPKLFEGMFTSRGEAQKVINIYAESKGE